INDKIFSLTMDNTTTNKAAIRMLQEELSNIDLISIGCMCHILNLIVNAGMAEINKLQQKIKTRWNSVLDMFKRYIILHPVVKEMQLKELSMPLCLETNELSELESICKILKPFEIATTILSKD
ncbi:14892_t:CDS:2, partial [Gigaspora rosea]